VEDSFGESSWTKLRLGAMQANFVLTSVALLALTAGYKHPATAILLGGVVYANYGGLLALFPAATAIFFGNKYLGRIYGAIFTSWGVAGLLGHSVAD